jgi:protein-disulfide isomerase
MKKNYLCISLGMMLIILFLACPGLAQTSDELKDLSKELEELKENQKAMQRDLQQIKSILRARGLLEEVPQNLFIDISGRPFKGDKNAKLTLVEFSEYQ